MLYINVGRYYVCDRYERQKIKNSLFYSKGKNEVFTVLTDSDLERLKAAEFFLVS